MAEEEVFELEKVNKIFYGPHFLYNFILNHKKELGLPENFKIGGGKRFKDKIYPIRKQAYSPFKTTYEKPHINLPKMEVSESDKEIRKLDDIIKDKKDEIWELMEKEGLPQKFKDEGKIKIKIENKEDFDDLLKTPKEFIKVIKRRTEYNYKKTIQNIKDLEADLNYFEDINAEYKKNLVQNGILKGNETDKEIDDKLKEINKRLKQLRPKHNHNTATEAEEAEYKLLDNAKDKIKEINENKTYITKDKAEIEKANDYKKSLEEKHNKYLENKDKIKEEKRIYETKLKEEKDNIEKEYNEKLKNIEENKAKEIEKIKQNAEITAKEKNKQLKDLEKEHNEEIEKLEKDKEDAVEKYYAKIEELEENKHNIDFLEKKIKEIEKEVKNKEKIITEQHEEIETKKKMVAHANTERHKLAVEKKQLKDELKAKEEQTKTTYQPSNTPPTLKDYIKDKVINKSYSLEKDELMNVIEKDINEHRLPKDIDVSKLADTIYLQGAKYINKHMKKIKSLVKLTGYDNDLYNKLPPELAEEIRKYINDKALEDIRNKNIRYILPKEMPRWEKAVNKGINPMLGRGAWSK